jgi:thioredoxin
MPELVTDAAALRKVTETGAPVIIDFFADWCGPCQEIAPQFSAWEEEFTGVTFLKVDVDNAATSDVAAQFAVDSLPTFVVLRGGHVIKRIEGANVAALQRTLTKLAEGKTKVAKKAAQPTKDAQPAKGSKLTRVAKKSKGVKVSVKKGAKREVKPAVKKNSPEWQKNKLKMATDALLNAM